jgi:hypothetical protein
MAALHKQTAPLVEVSGMGQRPVCDREGCPEGSHAWHLCYPSVLILRMGPGREQTKIIFHAHFI